MARGNDLGRNPDPPLPQRADGGPNRCRRSKPHSAVRWWSRDCRSGACDRGARDLCHHTRRFRIRDDASLALSPTCLLVPDQERDRDRHANSARSPPAVGSAVLLFGPHGPGARRGARRWSACVWRHTAAHTGPSARSLQGRQGCPHGPKLT